MKFSFVAMTLALPSSLLAEGQRSNLRGLQEEIGRKLDVNPYEREEISIYDGVWGGWQGWSEETPGYYACGARIRYEHPCGSCDDTAANGLKLKFCSLIDWDNLQREKVIYGGHWGDWFDWVMCPKGQYIAGGQVRFENPIDGDDTALNGLELFCTNKDWTEYSKIIPASGDWGEWKGWKYATPGKLVKAARVRFEDPCGGCDDTAMNGIRFIAEKPYDPLKYGDTMYLQNRRIEGYEKYPRWLSGARNVGNEGVLVRNALSDYELFSAADTYKWTIQSVLATTMDPKVSECLRYGDTFHLRNEFFYNNQYRWLSGSRDGGNEKLLTRIPSDEPASKDEYYVWVVRSDIEVEIDPLHGECIEVNSEVYLQNGNPNPHGDRWLTGSRNAGTEGVYTRNMFKNDYEQNNAAVTYKWTLKRNQFL